MKDEWIVRVEQAPLSFREQRALEVGLPLAVGLFGAAILLEVEDVGDVRAPATVAGVAVALAALLLRRAHEASRRAVLTREGVERTHDGWRARAFVPWTGVVGYRDADAGAVVLALRERLRLSRTFAIPTHTERDRTAVLAFLDDQGIPRLE